MLHQDHICPRAGPCVYCAVRRGDPLPANLYVFPPPLDARRARRPFLVPVEQDAVFQAYLRLPAAAKKLVAGLILTLARAVGV